MYNMHKKFALSLTLIIFSAKICLALSPIDYIHKDPWAYLGYKLFELPLKESKKLKSRLLTFGPSGLSTALAYKILKQKTHFDTKKNLLISIIPGIFTWYILNSKIYNHIQANNFKKFIKDWPNNKKFSPTSLHTAFDQAHELYSKNNEQFEEELEEILSLTKKRIIDELPENLRKQYIEANIFSTNVVFDIGSILNGFANLITVYNNNKAKIK